MPNLRLCIVWNAVTRYNMHFGMMILVRNMEDSEEQEDKEARNRVYKNAGVAQEHLVYRFTLQGIGRNDKTVVRKVELIGLDVWLKRP